MRVSEHFASLQLAGKGVTVDSEVATNARTLHTLNVTNNFKTECSHF
jgi:hypothetical protein